MSAMTVADALTAVRSLTAYDLVTPSPVTNAMLTVWLDQAVKRLRRRIVHAVPSFYHTTSSTTTLVSGGTQFIAKPADFESLVRLERLGESSPASWSPAFVSDPLSPDDSGGPGFLEEGPNFVVRGTQEAPGVYRIVYSAGPSVGYTALEVPEGFEDVVIEEVCARVKERLPTGDPTFHLQLSEQIYQTQIGPLKRRYGMHMLHGLRQLKYGP